MVGNLILAISMTACNYPAISIFGQFVEYFLRDMFKAHHAVKWCSVLNVYLMAYGHFNNRIPRSLIVRHAQLNSLFSLLSTVDPLWAMMRDLNKIVINTSLMMNTHPPLFIYYVELFLCVMARLFPITLNARWVF